MSRLLLSGQAATRLSQPEAFARILRAFDYKPGRALAIGDAITEYDAARALGIPFLGVVAAGEQNPFPQDLPAVSTLEGLAERLGFAR